MQDDRKKLMILGVLAVVIIAVGAFQLKPSSSAAPASNKPSASPVVASRSSGDVAESSSALPELSERDPFEAPAKPAHTEIRQAPAHVPAAAANLKPVPGSLPPMPFSGTQLVKDPPSAVAAPKPEPTLTWRLSGVVVGAHPLAVLTDPTGNQRLIRVGSMIDPDTRLLSVDERSATLIFRGKTLRLLPAGNPNAK